MAIAMPVFALALFAPGYVLGWAANLFAFRQMSWPHRLLWAIAYSFALTPILSYWAGKYAGLNAVCGILLALTIAAAALIAGERPTLHRRPLLITATATLLGSAFIFLMLADLQIGHKLYFSVVEFDQSYRVAFTQSVLRSGVPPANPLYFAGGPQPMRYYYVWYVVCAVVAKLAHVSARQAFFASSAWAGIGLVAITALFTKHFSTATSNAKRRATIAVALLAVTGADLLPSIGALCAGAFNGDMEWWSVDQISSWQDSILWVPHHTAALIACLVAILLVRKAQLESGNRVLLGILAGTAFASAFGMSVYLAAGTAILFAAWLLHLLLHRRPLRAWALNTTSLSVTALCLLAPLLREFLSAAPASSRSTQTSHVLQLGLREMIYAQPLAGIRPFRWFGHPAADILAKLLLLPVGLALELGVYAVTLWIVVRRRTLPSDENRSLTLFLALTGLVIVCCVRSTVIGNNDFGYRAAMLPQFFLLLLTAELLTDGWPQLASSQKRILTTFLVLGFAGTLYQAVVLRTYLPIEEHVHASGFAQLPEHLFQAHEALTTFQQTAPPDAVWQFNPFPPPQAPGNNVVQRYIYFDRALLIYGGRQTLNAEPACAAEFGGDTRPCAAIMDATAALYAATTTAAQARTYCRHFGVGYLAASDTDAPWATRESWVWTLPVVAEQPAFRIVRCTS